MSVAMGGRTRYRHRRPRRFSSRVALERRNHRIGDDAIGIPVTRSRVRAPVVRHVSCTGPRTAIQTPARRRIAFEVVGASRRSRPPRVASSPVATSSEILTGTVLAQPRQFDVAETERGTEASRSVYANSSHDLDRYVVDTTRNARPVVRTGRSCGWAWDTQRNSV